MIPTFDPRDGPTDEMRTALEEVGAIRLPGFASPEEAAGLRQAWSEMSDRFVADGTEVVNGIPIKYGARPDGSRYVQRFAFSSLFSPTIERFVHDPRFELVRELCGGESRLGDVEKDGVVLNCYRNEEGSRYRQLGWHTDGLRDLAYGRLPRPQFNVGVYLDDSPKEKGALRLIPGSHKQGLWRMITRKAYFIDHRPDPDEVVLEAKAGDLTIHDGRLWHRVGRSELTGEASTRRTMYVPFIDGPYEPKDEHSKMPFYHHLQRLTG